MNLLNHTQTSMIASLEIGNGYVIVFYTESYIFVGFSIVWKPIVNRSTLYTICCSDVK